MIGLIIKIVVIAVIALVVLNFINPDMASEVTEVISEKTGVDQSTINEKLDSATEYAVEKTKETIEDNK